MVVFRLNITEFRRVFQRISSEISSCLSPPDEAEQRSHIRRSEGPAAPSRHVRPIVCPRAAPRSSAGFWLSVQRLGTSPVPQSACPALDLTATAASRPSIHCPKRALPVAARSLSVQGVGRLFSASPSQHGAPLTANAPPWSSGGVLYTLLSMPSTWYL